MENCIQNIRIRITCSYSHPAAHKSRASAARLRHEKRGERNEDGTSSAIEMKMRRNNI